jgi:hypothetical protein
LSGKLRNKWLDDGSSILNVMEHIKKNTHCTQGDAMLVLVDNNTHGAASDGM